MGFLGGRASVAILMVATLLPACHRGPRQLAVGLSLETFPHAGGAPLAALTPIPATLVVALRNPRQTLDAVEASDLAKWMRAQGLLEDQAAWPWLERWRILQARLAELSRQPVPELLHLLEAPAMVSVSPSGSWLYVARTNAGTALAFAETLNGVHPSGREVELDRRHGIPLRLVRFGNGRLVYYVLADRLVLSDDLALLQRSLDIFFSDSPQGSARASPRFSPLESQAETTGLALSFDGQHAPAVAAALGLRAWSATPEALSVDFDPQRWGSPTAGSPQLLAAPTVSTLGMRVDLPGLQPAAVWQAIRPASNPTPLSNAVDGVASHLGRGLWIRAAEESEGGLGFTAWLSRRADEPQEDRQLADLSRLLLSGPPREVALAGNGMSWCAASGGLCLASCPGLVGVTNRGERIAAAGCPELAASAPDEPWLALELDGEGQIGPLFRATAAPQGGHLRWAGP
jgi:hypothetical protein